MARATWEHKGQVRDVHFGRARYQSSPQLVAGSPATNPCCEIPPAACRRSSASVATTPRTSAREWQAGRAVEFSPLAPTRFRARRPWSAGLAWAVDCAKGGASRPSRRAFGRVTEGARLAGAGSDQRSKRPAGRRDEESLEVMTTGRWGSPIPRSAAGPRRARAGRRSDEHWWRIR